MKRTLFVLLFLPLSAWSATPADEALEPVPQLENGISYVSGGIGEDGGQTTKGLRNDYNVLMTFAVRGTGQYLADTDVTVQDMRGRTLLDTTSPGPLFYAKLPPGKYRITADYQGRPVTQTIRIERNRKPADLYFYWNNE